MSLTLYYHPLASFCQKVLIALYENETPFEPHFVDLGDAASSAAFKKLWPMGKIPGAARRRAGSDDPRVEHHHRVPGATLSGHEPALAADAELARETRLRDRFFDLYVHEPMQKIVTDRLRPADKHDPYGVEEARALLQTAYGMIERDMATRPGPWATPSPWPTAPPRPRCSTPTWSSRSATRTSNVGGLSGAPDGRARPLRAS